MELPDAASLRPDEVVQQRAPGGYPASEISGGVLPKPAQRVPPLRMPLSERRKLFARPMIDVAAVRGTEATSTKSGDILLTNGVSNRSPVNPTSSFAAQYELGGALGSGSMAVVKRAKRRSDATEFAVKCVALEDEELLQFTRDEYDLLRELCVGHSAILKVYDMMEQGPKMWIVMELCSDGSVQGFTERHGAFREAAACQLFWQLLHGVNYLHSRRVVHRDLKPDNLLLRDGASNLRIADFNSAKRVGTGAGGGLMLTDRGTQLYSAPELRFGRLWNERIDVWTSGLCLFFMLRACIPFNPEAPGAAKQLLSGQLPHISWGGVRRLVQNLVLQCLTVNMQDRPPAMELLHHPAFSSPELSLKPMEPGDKGPSRRASEHADSSCKSEQVVRRTGSNASKKASKGFEWDEGVLPACGLLVVRLPCDQPSPSTPPPPSRNKSLEVPESSEAMQRRSGKRPTNLYPKDTAEAIRILALRKCERDLAAEGSVANVRSAEKPSSRRSTRPPTGELESPKAARKAPSMSPARSPAGSESTEGEVVQLPPTGTLRRPTGRGDGSRALRHPERKTSLNDMIAAIGRLDDGDDDEEEEGIILPEEGEIIGGSPSSLSGASPSSLAGPTSPYSDVPVSRYWTNPPTAIQWNT